MAKRRRKLDPNRFQQTDEQELFSFDETRKALFKRGLMAGALSGLFFIQSSFIWQIVGFLIIFFITNPHIEKASRRIPRWHAVFYSLGGTLATMLLIIIIGNLLVVYLAGGTAGQ